MDRPVAQQKWLTLKVWTHLYVINHYAKARKRVFSRSREGCLKIELEFCSQIWQFWAKLRACILFSVPICKFVQIFLAPQDALEVMGVRHSVMVN